MIQQYKNFYLLDDKLLYISDQFIGFAPFISKEFQFHYKEEGTKVNVEECEIENETHTSILTTFKGKGPLRGFIRIEIIRNGNTEIFYESGGKGHGYSYSKGSRINTKYDQTYLLVSSYDLTDKNSGTMPPGFLENKWYLLHFNKIIIPEINKAYPVDDKLKKEFPIYEKDKELTKIIWQVKTVFANHELEITKTSVSQGWQGSVNKNGKINYANSKNLYAVESINLSIDGIPLIKNNIHI